MAMPWSQQEKLVLAGDTLSGNFEPAALGAGMHIEQMNIRLDPPAGQEGDKPTTVVFNWDTEANEYTMWISG